MTLSLACITNVASPSEMHGRRSLAGMKKFSRRRRRSVLFPVRKRSTHTHESPCDRIVASAAPRTPIPSAKMNTGSSAMFSAAPSTTSRIACAAKPCAMIIWFSPAASSAKTVPVRYTVK